MVFNTGTTESRNNQTRNNSYQSNGNRQNNRYENTKRNLKGNNSPYSNNRYPKDSRKQSRRDMTRYEKEGKPKHYNNGYNRSLNKVQIEESLDEIKNDIERLYKEIKVEIDLIKSIKFFLGYTSKENVKTNQGDD